MQGQASVQLARKRAVSLHPFAEVERATPGAVLPAVDHVAGLGRETGKSLTTKRVAQKNEAMEYTVETECIARRSIRTAPPGHGTPWDAGTTSDPHLDPRPVQLPF